jgi:hypothetical protein
MCEIRCMSESWASFWDRVCSLVMGVCSRTEVYSGWVFTFLLLVMKSRRFDEVLGRTTKYFAATFRGGFRVSVRGAAGMEHNPMQMSSPHIKKETL